MLFHHQKEPNILSLCREYALPREDEEEICRKRVDPKQRTIRSCLGDDRFAKHLEDIALKLKFHVCWKTKPILGSER